jgi:hypothetical protein
MSFLLPGEEGFSGDVIRSFELGRSWAAQMFGVG